MERAGDLRRAPGLVHAQTADDVRDLLVDVVSAPPAAGSPLRRADGRVRRETGSGQIDDAVRDRTRRFADFQRELEGFPYRIAPHRGVLDRESHRDAVAELRRKGGERDAAYGGVRTATGE